MLDRDTDLRSSSTPRSSRHSTRRGRRASVPLVLLALLLLPLLPASSAGASATGPGPVPVPEVVRLDTGRSLVAGQLVRDLERLPGGAVRVYTNRDIQTLAATTATAPLTPTVGTGNRAAAAAAGLGWSATEVAGAWWDAHVDGTGAVVAFVCRTDVAYSGGWQAEDDCLLRRRTGQTWQTLTGGGDAWLDPRSDRAWNYRDLPSKDRYTRTELADVRLAHPASAVLDRTRQVLYFTEAVYFGGGWLWAYDLTSGELSRVSTVQDLSSIRLRPDGTLLGETWSDVVVVDPTTGLTSLTGLTSDGGVVANDDGSVWTNDWSGLVRTELDVDSPPQQQVTGRHLYDALGGVRTAAMLDDPAGLVLAVHPVGDYPQRYPAAGLYRVATAPRVPSQVSGVRATPSDRAVAVTWRASDGYGFPVSGYEVSVHPGGQSRTVPADASSTTFTGLVNGTSYRFDVQARSDVGLSPLVTGGSATSAPRDTVPPGPVALGAPQVTSSIDASNVVTTSATLRWTAATAHDLHSVVVVRKQCGCVPSSPTDGDVVYRGTGTSATVTGLRAGASYGFAVYVRDTSGNHSPARTTVVPGTTTSLSTTTTDGLPPTSRIVTGSNVAFLHTLRFTETPDVIDAPAVVKLQVRYRGPDGSWGSWSTVANRVVDGGPVQVAHRPSRNAQYRAVHVGTDGRSASVSAAPKVDVAMAVSATARAGKVRRGTSVTVSGSVAPAHPGRVVLLQARTGSGWTTVVEQKLSSTSSYRFSTRRTTAASVTYRVVSSADGDHATGVSAARTVTWS